jgi:hypothetical protein
LKKLSFAYPPKLEILSFTPGSAENFSGDPPSTLSVLIIRHEGLTDTIITEESVELVAKASSVRSLAIVEEMCNYYYFGRIF